MRGNLSWGGEEGKDTILQRPRETKKARSWMQGRKRGIGKSQNLEGSLGKTRETKNTD